MKRAVLVCVALAATAPLFAAGPQEAATRWNVGSWTVWRIDRPASPAARDYPDIQIQPGDRVVVDAGGCAAGARIALGGATDGLVPLGGILRRELPVPAGAAPAPLRLGGACPSTDAWIMVGIHHAAADEPLPLPRPMDLVSNGSVDASGIPRNPKWGLQQTQPGTLPNPVELCFDVPGWFDNPICTVQRPTVDRPVGVKGVICGLGGTTPISGHVNWFAATYEGPVFWHGKFWSDQDINISLVPPGQSGLTTAAPEAILGEFDARETLNHFATPWWSDLRRAANLSADDRARALLDGRPAIITGLLGLDCEHDCGSELHPVWALGIRAKAETRRETWALFARNWGNEGFCSSAQHHLEVVGHRLTVSVPWREGATGVRPRRGTKFFANVDGVRGWWTAVPGQHVNVTFQLPAPELHGRVHGELVLAWSGAPADVEPIALGRPPEREREEGVEPLVEELVRGLTPRQRRRLAAREPRVAAADTLPVVLQRGPPPSLGARALFAPSVRAVPDPQRDVEDLRRLQVLMDVYDGKVPGPLQDVPRLLEPR